MKTGTQLIFGIGAALICAGLSYLLEQSFIRKRKLEKKAGRALHMAVYAFLILSGVLFLMAGSTAAEAVYFFLLLTLIGAATLMDGAYRIIPNDIVLALIGLKLLYGGLKLLGVPGVAEFRFLPALAGFGACFIIFLLPAFRGRNIGAGDVKLAAAMGFCLGLKNSLTAVVLMGLAVLGYMMVKSRLPLMKTVKSTIPMAPFLGAGMIISTLLSQSGLTVF